MITRKELFTQLADGGVTPEDTVLIHSSMKAFGRYEGDIDGLISDLSCYLDRGILLIPTHTWANINKRSPVFDVNTSVPCIGLLPRIAAQRKDGIRSHNPTHSMMAFGKDKEDFIKGEEKISSPTPLEGCYGKLIGRDAVILLVGVGYNRNTFFHCLEEIAGLPYRLSKESTSFVVSDGKMTQKHPMQTIFCPYCQDVSAFYPILRPILTQGGAEREFVLGEAPTIACRAKRASELLLPIMERAKDAGSDYLLPDARLQYEKKIKRNPFYWFKNLFH